MDIIQNLLTKNSYSRPGSPMGELKAVAIHWVAGLSKQTAQGIRDYFEGHKFDKIYGSAHYIIGPVGEIIQAVPENEVAYHIGHGNTLDPVTGLYYTSFARDLFGENAQGFQASPNPNAIGIELCHSNSDGSFSEKTLTSLIELCYDIFHRHPELDPHKHLITHNMVVNWKACPKWYVDHPAELEHLRYEVAKRLK